jgi:hypothetical protein
MKEQKVLDMGVRLLCLSANVDEKKVQNNKLNERDWARLTRACGRLIENASEGGRRYWGDVFNDIFNHTYGVKNGTN